MPGASEETGLAKIRIERDFYRRLLELGVQTELEPFLAEALALIVEMSGARQGYIELHGSGRSSEPACHLARGFSADQIEVVRSQISSGIVAEALSTGRSVHTPSAMLDLRFLERASVRASRIEAVLCVPIGQPPLGVLYLQGRGEQGAFPKEDCERAQLFARHLAPLAGHVLLRRRIERAEDPTAPYRERLRADGVVGRSETLAALLRDVSLVAPLDVNVLLTGESGTGKTLVARLIHDSGPRATGPLIELNCAALPESLIESELFGARPGSHSAATREMAGKVAAAEGGTLLLDEIAELTAAAQSKLLQLLQTRRYYPLGATAPVSADVRLVAATNADLHAAVAAGRFREDLLYRLMVLPIRVPSLAERRGDIPELASRFCEGAVERHRLPHLALSAEAVYALEGAEWPGNLRQLEHAVEAGAIRAAGQGGGQIERAHLFPDTPAPERPDEGEPSTFQEATRRFQAGLLRRCLEESSWNVSETARRLDVARSHVYKLISAFGLERDGD